MLAPGTGATPSRSAATTSSGSSWGRAGMRHPGARASPGPRPAAAALSLRPGRRPRLGVPRVRRLGRGPARRTLGRSNRTLGLLNRPDTSRRCPGARCSTTKRSTPRTGTRSWKRRQGSRSRRRRCGSAPSRRISILPGGGKSRRCSRGTSNRPSRGCGPRTGGTSSTARSASTSRTGRTTSACGGSTSRTGRARGRPRLCTSTWTWDGGASGASRCTRTITSTGQPRVSRGASA
mmetsp:Transcript_101116/g.286610  ORF Transcript_101116/g.286610 Transcript_101116/m.286610 type:complete len:235 (-) Transcript_101116:313-1017(-)